MRDSYILRLIQYLKEAMAILAPTMTSRDLEELSFTIYRSMGNTTRDFHNINHVLSFLPQDDPEFVLAAVFHDIVYYQVDGDFPQDLKVLLTPWCATRNGKADINWDYSPDLPERQKELLEINIKIFGLRRGDSFASRGGFNEFFSSLAMLFLLDPWCTRETLMSVAVCIEASIPFRGEDAQGKSSEENLYQRLVDIITKCCPDTETLSPDVHALGMIHRAVRFSNKDVQDFGALDAAKFLSGTWKLLPELNRSLRIQGHCTVREYRKALQGMLGFFGSLSSDRIFHSFRDVPSTEEMNLLRSHSAENLRVAEEYLQAKLMGISFLDAAACFSGGDMPLAYFMGDIPHDGEETHRLETHLKYPALPRCEKGVTWHLLKNGRLGRSNFDLTNSPLSLFFFEAFNSRDFKAASLVAKEFLLALDDASKKEDGKPGEHTRSLCKKWIATFPQGVSEPVLKALAHMAPTRAELILELL